MGLSYCFIGGKTKVFKYLRLNAFYKLLQPFSKIMRKGRMELFVTIMKPNSAMKILDLGGQPDIWDFIQFPLNITCLNLPGVTINDYQSHHQITYIEGDACDMNYFQPGDFDLVFSNSVIEHVGEYEKRLQFAREVLRLSNRYWIQTPSKYFPIEAHCGMPFWWFYPQPLRSYFLRKWAAKVPAWTEMVASTSVVSSQELKSILPNCKIIREWWFLFPKSSIAYRV
jgi:SAM-dependent methyltransferase